MERMAVAVWHHSAAKLVLSAVPWLTRHLPTIPWFAAVLKGMQPRAGVIVE
jgi:hypothetical protein